MHRLRATILLVITLAVALLHLGVLILLLLLLLPLHILSRWWKGEKLNEIFTRLGD